MKNKRNRLNYQIIVDIAPQCQTFITKLETCAKIPFSEAGKKVLKKTIIRKKMAPYSIKFYDTGNVGAGTGIYSSQKQ